MFNNSLKLLTWNAYSTQNKIIELIDFFEEYKADVLEVSETWRQGKNKIWNNKSRICRNDRARGCFNIWKNIRFPDTKIIIDIKIEGINTTVIVVYFTGTKLNREN